MYVSMFLCEIRNRLFSYCESVIILWKKFTVELENLEPPTMEGLDALLAVSLLDSLSECYFMFTVE